MGKDRYHFNQVNHLVQSKIKSAYNNYLADILGVGSERGWAAKILGLLQRNYFLSLKIVHKILRVFPH